jgi:hypothetical protein
MILRIALLLVGIPLLVHGAEGLYRVLTLPLPGLRERSSLVLPALEAIAGALALLLLVVLSTKARRRGQRAAAPEVAPVQAPPVAGTPEGTGGTDLQRPDLSRLMLVNLPPRSAPWALEDAPPLGPQAAVRGAMARVLPGIHFTDDGVGHFEGPGHAIRVDLGSGAETWTATLDVSGNAAAPALKRLIIQTGWQAYAPRLGRFITAEDLKS